MLYSGTDPESYITEYTLVYEDNERPPRHRHGRTTPNPTSCQRQARNNPLKSDRSSWIRSTNASLKWPRSGELTKARNLWWCLIMVDLPDSAIDIPVPQKPETRKLKPETRNPKTETCVLVSWCPAAGIMRRCVRVDGCAVLSCPPMLTVVSCADSSCPDGSLPVPLPELT